MSNDFSIPEFPDELAARIHEIALKTGATDEEVVSELVHTFFELVDNPQQEAEPCLVRRIRRALREKFGMALD